VRDVLTRAGPGVLGERRAGVGIGRGLAVTVGGLSVVMRRGLPADVANTTVALGTATVALPAAWRDALGGECGEAVDAIFVLLPPTSTERSAVLGAALLSAVGGAPLPVADFPPLAATLPVPRVALTTNWFCSGVPWAAVNSSMCDWHELYVSTRSNFTHVTCVTRGYPVMAAVSTFTVQRVAGCLDADTFTVFCPPDGGFILTVTGLQFGRAGAAVFLGSADQACSNATHVRGAETTTLLCEVPRQGWRGEMLPVIVVVNGTATTTPGTVHVSFAAAPVVQSIHAERGCVDEAPTGEWVRGCSASGAPPLTVSGLHFAGDGAVDVSVGPFTCPRVQVLGDERLLCEGVHGPGSDLPITVAKGPVRNEQLANASITVSYVGPPGITFIRGCNRMNAVHIAQCPSNGSFVLEVGGWNFGVRGARVLLQHPVLGAAGCATTAHSPTAPDSALIATGCTGRFGNWTVVVVALNGLGSAPLPGQATPTVDFAESCPALSSGTLCGGHGRCSLALAQCVCVNESSLGFWAGPACLECAPGFFCPTCTFSCPRPDSLAACSGHGSCFDGRLGNGTCACSAGYVGLDCSQVSSLQNRKYSSHNAASTLYPLSLDMSCVLVYRIPQAYLPRTSECSIRSAGQETQSPVPFFTVNAHMPHILKTHNVLHPTKISLHNSPDFGSTLLAVFGWFRGPGSQKLRALLVYEGGVAHNHRIHRHVGKGGRDRGIVLGTSSLPAFCH
jgi:hypothetical protein